MAAVERYMEQGEEAPQGKVSDSSLLISDEGKLILRVEVDLTGKSIETAQHINPISVYVEFPTKSR